MNYLTLSAAESVFFLYKKNGDSFFVKYLRSGVMHYKTFVTEKSAVIWLFVFLFTAAVFFHNLNNQYSQQINA